MGWSSYEDKEYWNLDLQAVGGDDFMSDLI